MALRAFGYTVQLKEGIPFVCKDTPICADDTGSSEQTRHMLDERFAYIEGLVEQTLQELRSWGNKPQSRSTRKSR